MEDIYVIYEDGAKEYVGSLGEYAFNTLMDVLIRMDNGKTLNEAIIENKYYVQDNIYAEYPFASVFDRAKLAGVLLKAQKYLSGQQDNEEEMMILAYLPGMISGENIKKVEIGEEDDIAIAEDFAFKWIIRDKNDYFLRGIDRGNFHHH